MSSAQARAHLLCADCERLFNDGGEDWVLKNCWRSPTIFPLHSALSVVTPFVDGRSFSMYEGRGIAGVDMDKLAYFGASIFWRASVCDWRVGRQKEQRIPLGPFRERLRLYLLGSTGIPDGIVLFVTVSKTVDDMHNRIAAMPWYYHRTPEYRGYKFIVTGLTFQLLVGMMIPTPIRGMCSARRGYVYMSEDGDADLLNTMAIMEKRAEAKGKLANLGLERRLIL